MNADDFNPGLLAFLDDSPSPFHAVSALTMLLDNAAFSRSDFSHPWPNPESGKIYLTRNDSSLIAIRQGKGSITDRGVRIIGAHTDSPCLKIKPQPDIRRAGAFQLGVEIYGGALLAPWFDRDLSIAGRISARRTDGGRASLLLDFKRAVALIPSLAIHLNRDIHKNRTINPQEELVPILFNGDEHSLETFRDALLDEAREQHPNESLGEVTDFELSLYDTHRAAQVGLYGDFLVSARLDNLLSCYAAIKALMDANTDETILVICNDHEEVGSTSTAGAQGPFLRQALERLTGDAQALSAALSRSALVSADNAHAVHPNYENKHDPQHRPQLNKGPVIKFNANQRYATTSSTAALFRDLCRHAQVPVQSMAMRSDMACGSTIGPITSAVIGIDTVDVGAPQLGMHSIRETTGWQDPAFLYRALAAFFESP